jgi:FAD:protein FMN transferase
LTDVRANATVRRAVLSAWLLASAQCNDARDTKPRPTATTADQEPDVPLAGQEHAASKKRLTAVPAGPVEESILRRDRKMMGTIIQITIVGESAERAASAADAALDEMERLERVLSEWRPDSEISRINAAAGERAVTVGPDTLAVVRAGLAVSRWSKGAFDQSWAALRGLYTFQPGEETVPDSAELRRKLSLIDYRKIKLDERASTVKLLKKGMLLGTGSIAKGYALDRASAILDRAGIENYMILGGGQVQVHGLRKGRPWRVGIQHPRKNDYFACRHRCRWRPVSPASPDAHEPA